MYFLFNLFAWNCSAHAKPTPFLKRSLDNWQNHHMFFIFCWHFLASLSIYYSINYLLKVFILYQISPFFCGWYLFFICFYSRGVFIDNTIYVSKKIILNSVASKIFTHSVDSDLIFLLWRTSQPLLNFEFFQVLSQGRIVCWLLCGMISQKRNQGKSSSQLKRLWEHLLNLSGTQILCNLRKMISERILGFSYL